MAPSESQSAWDAQSKDAKRILAEDKYDDCLSCRITGTNNHVERDKIQDGISEIGHCNYICNISRHGNMEGFELITGSKALGIVRAQNENKGFLGAHADQNSKYIRLKVHNNCLHWVEMHETNKSTKKFLESVMM
ncbi:uncharacterized protein AFUA_4G13480 [Aspergillus fumigatus Af293]|uniref:Uncharacterized protein n=2 Tax=Aspergillus fumigatus TaxID=746128 RepID=Q4WQN9_ASPFU|nr:hypothetical protein AFUA_4G13480 [Aspergillus fumigatus Af293]EAL89445.1 hypothetical protein AFUA_4G13480 [Aspergillus fumigatus Af293]EDP50700.1 hypothetical protein AFUB_070400 [Aspergillus fumigatus A1163]